MVRRRAQNHVLKGWMLNLNPESMHAWNPNKTSLLLQRNTPGSISSEIMCVHPDGRSHAPSSPWKTPIVLPKPLAPCNVPSERSGRSLMVLPTPEQEQRARFSLLGRNLGSQKNGNGFSRRWGLRSGVLPVTERAINGNFKTCRP